MVRSPTYPLPPSQQVSQIVRHWPHWSFPRNSIKWPPQAGHAGLVGVVWWADWSDFGRSGFMATAPGAWTFVHVLAGGLVGGQESGQNDEETARNLLSNLLSGLDGTHSISRRLTRSRFRATSP